MRVSRERLWMSLTRAVALFAMLLAVIPRIGCESAPGQAFCPSALLSLAVDRADSCDEGTQCPCCEHRSTEPLPCPTSGKPCKAFVYMGNWVPPDDPVSVPLPLDCAELILVKDAAPVVSTVEKALDRRWASGTCPSLVDMGQLLRV